MSNWRNKDIVTEAVMFLSYPMVITKHSLALFKDIGHSWQSPGEINEIQED